MKLGSHVSPRNQRQNLTRKLASAWRASAENRVKNGDISFARRVNDDPTNLTSFGKKNEPSLAREKYIVDALVKKGAKAPKPHLPPVEVRMLSSAADGLLFAGTGFTAMRTIFPRPPISWSLGEETKRRTGRRNEITANYCV